MKEISLPGSDRPNSSSLPRMHQMSHEHSGNLLSNASSRIHTRTCLRAKSLSYPITSPSAKEEAACTALVPCSLKLLVLQDSSPPLPSSARYSQRVAASRFVNISWGWRSGKTDLTAHIKEGDWGRQAELGRRNRNSLPRLFLDFERLNRNLRAV